jgi:hypothetical protein
MERPKFSELLANMREEYVLLAEELAAAPLVLADLLASDVCYLPDYCRNYKPHPDAALIHSHARQFAEHHNIWIPSTEYYISCQTYLYPIAVLDRIKVVNENFMLTFYMNDTFGREKFAKLSILEQNRVTALQDRLLLSGDDLVADRDAGREERSNVAASTAIRNLSSAEWFAEFSRLWNCHVSLCYADLNCGARGFVPGLDDYIEERCHVSGMYYSAHFIEFANGQFLDWLMLEQAGLAIPLKRLFWLTSVLGCLMNDLFSFEKECIDDLADNNLVAILLLNHSGVSLQDAINKAGGLIRDYLAEFVTLIRDVENQYVSLMDDASRRVMERYLLSLELCVQASWVWEVQNPRYCRPTSIWKETRVV